MTQRSLKASSAGISKAKKAFENKGWTQAYLAAEVGLSSRQSIWKFFTGKPIERYIFQEICFNLDLNWEEIADLPVKSSNSSHTTEEAQSSAIADWVQLLRSQLSEQIQSQCNTLQSSFEETQPLLSQVYTPVNILPRSSHQRWLEISDFQEVQGGSERFNLGQLYPEAIPGMKVVANHDKLMILGKPGAGKTTFLQYLALQCNQGKYKRDLVPLFIQLRFLPLTERAESDLSLHHYILRQGEICGLSEEQTLTLLQQGKFLLLLDGLDEIPLKERETILKIIDNFTQVFYKNTIFITSRGTFDNYHFRGFNYVEIADFDDRQIKHFAHKWFSVNTLNKTEGNYKAEQFLEQLQHPENQPIRELGITPILLNLICSVFNEKLSFPCKRAKLYQAGLDILLKRWDRARGIQRDRVYYDLDLLDKIRLLCQIAATTFEQGKYFFETHDILSIIENYLHASPTLNPDLETLWLTSEAILKAIELQHGLLVERAKGIYSFSHLTFQEYLTARKIVSNSNSTLEEALKRLANHVLDLQWREVIYLTASMLPNADFLFQELQKNINKLLKQDSELDAFLGVINQKVMRLQVNCKKTAIRAFYFTIFQERDLNLAVTLDVNFVNKNLPEELNLDATLTRILTDCLMLVENSNFQKFLNLCFSLDLENRFQLTPAFKAAFRELKSQLPDITQGQETIETWWRTQGSDWVENYRSLLIEHRQIGHHWQLGQEHQALWHQYYLANLFLAQCLQSDCPMSPDVRQQIEATLLLPTSDLKAEG